MAELHSRLQGRPFSLSLESVGLGRSTMPRLGSSWIRTISSRPSVRGDFRVLCGGIERAPFCPRKDRATPPSVLEACRSRRARYLKTIGKGGRSWDKDKGANLKGIRLGCRDAQGPPCPLARGGGLRGHEGCPCRSPSPVPDRPASDAGRGRQGAPLQPVARRQDGTVPTGRSRSIFSSSSFLRLGGTREAIAVAIMP